MTFDVEVWCDGWNHLDSAFPRSFERYIFGASNAGRYALPKTMEILNKYSLHGVFFVEALFAARFGIEYLRRVVTLIRDAEQEIQLHLHPEWTDEIAPPPLPNISAKRQHLRYYSQEEQTELIRLGIQLLQEAGATRPCAFRAGNFAANIDTFRALAANGITCDSSVNACLPDSVPDLCGKVDLYTVREIEGIIEYPQSVFLDGFGRYRHAQIGACSAGELVQATLNARGLGWTHFVVLSHNFEMLKSHSEKPDWVVVRRFERYCQFLRQHADQYPTSGFVDLKQHVQDGQMNLPTVGRLKTLRRYAEQAIRRIM